MPGFFPVRDAQGSLDDWIGKRASPPGLGETSGPCHQPFVRRQRIGHAVSDKFRAPILVQRPLLRVVVACRRQSA